MKRFCILLILACLLFPAMAQELKVTSFESAPTDNAAVKYQVNDGNGDPCALVMVGLTVANAKFEGDIVKVEAKDSGEYWVYMVEGANWMEIKTDKYLPLRYDFKDASGKTISVTGKTTYTMNIEKPLAADDTPKGIMTLQSNVRNADVYVDGQKVSSGLPFNYEGSEGQHTVELKADGYNDEKLVIDMKLKRSGQKQYIRMKAAGSFSLDGISYEMVAVAGGKFWMGSRNDNNKYSTFNYDKPAHLVTLKSYSIGRTEVTQALWEAVMGSNPSIHQGANYPVENVSWNDCQEFIAKLNERCGTHFRLPTEAEWEYAAAARNYENSSSYSGGSTLESFARTGSTTAEVCSKSPNALGIYDMTGNVSEWCSDWLGKYSTAAATNPTGAARGVQKIVRGGSCADAEQDLQITHRDHARPDDISQYRGLRLAQD